jgi:hypothetical protein
LAHHTGPKEYSEKDVSRWWNGLDWKQRALIFEDLPWSRLDTKQRGVVRKKYVEEQKGT